LCKTVRGQLTWAEITRVTFFGFEGLLSVRTPLIRGTRATPPTEILAQRDECLTLLGYVCVNMVSTGGGGGGGGGAVMHLHYHALSPCIGYSGETGVTQDWYA
jgi:hypothetical protein